MNADSAEVKTDRRRARTRAALLQAGQTLFAAQSVDAVSIDDIVLTADVAKGSFYNHFPDQEGLAREIAVAVRAEAEAGTSSAAQVPGAAPSTCNRKPKRCVFWLDQRTPSVPPGSAWTTLMSSLAIPVANVTGPENDEYGASL